MNYRKIEKFSLISIIILCLIFIFIGYKYFLGIVLGGLASLFGLKMIEKLENMDISEIRVIKSKLRRNHLIRYLVYALVLLACFLRPNIFSCLTCFLGLLLTKIWIVVIETRELKEE